MFKLKPDATFSATVKVPNGDDPLSLKLKFKRLRKEDIPAWIEKAKNNSDPELLGEIVDGWIDVDAEFNADNFKELLSAYSGAGLAIFTGYLKALSEAERKN